LQALNGEAPHPVGLHLLPAALALEEVLVEGSFLFRGKISGEKRGTAFLRTRHG
jgi:hypothetical protein